MKFSNFLFVTLFPIRNKKGMSNNPTNEQRKRKIQEEIVEIIASKHGVSDRYVRMVISGERNNELIFSDYMFYKQEHNLLLNAVKNLVPFN